ncbi:hypothetical protein B0H17DRAFT_1152618 [Mycena rosella]|uniref:Uncharacterized protein n=1 Tax=Mycena rosella TaxID=1033263 RepID=A0AAD7BC18_MYCRO|nr:hypothetical protein B0H17DRAFT_1152618 [Mycena rosella]
MPQFQPQRTAEAQHAALPTHTDDMRRLPVLHAYTERSSWYLMQTSSAPLGYPDFSVGTNINEDPRGVYENSEDVYPAVEPLFSGDKEYPPDFAEEADTMSTDTMAMWANAPMGFQVNEWGMYFSELNHALGRARPQT